jgi:hypothetical protein
MSIDESLSEILDVEPISSFDEFGKEVIVYTAGPPPAPLPPQTTEEKISEDAELARQNIKGLLVKGGEALNSLINISSENQHPRSFEVVATMLKTLSEMNHDLLDTHKTKRDLIKAEPSLPMTGNTTIHAEKAIFFGSTAELSARLKAQQESNANGHTDIPQ